MRKVIELTRPDGHAIWINRDQIATIEPPLHGDNPKARARIRLAAGEFLSVCETVEDVARTLWSE